MTEGKPEGQVADESAVEVAPAETSPPETKVEEQAPAEATAVEVKAEEPAPAEAEAPSAEAAEAAESVAAAESAVPTAPAPRPSNLGIWAFVLALLGLVGLLPIIGSVLGFVIGRVAVSQSDSLRLRGGRGLAIAAVTVSVITLAVIALSIAAYALVVAYLEI